MAKHRRKPDSKKAIWLSLLGLVALSVLLGVFISGNDVILFNPKGFVADEQHRLMVVSTLIMLAFGVPIMFMLYFIAWKYRETNNKSEFDVNAGSSKTTGFLFWAAPTAIMVILASIMIPATHKFEPQNRIGSDEETLTVQVVGLRWKWLFIYPDQKIASVNFLQIPVDRPVEFLLTTDETPMSSFWIPHLGGQLYAMTEHINRLNLVGNEIGEYEGRTAEINGRGFSGMKFKTLVTSEEDFETWAENTSTSYDEFTQPMYDKLLEPSENNEIALYSKPVPGLFGNIVSKYSSGSHDHSAILEEYGEEH